MYCSTFLLGAGLAQLGLAAYTLKDDYSGNNFANMFSFDTEDDPTHGYVNYVDQNTAQSSGLFSVNNNVVTIRVDSTNVASGRGRSSVRVTSKGSYTHGLVVLDLAHMPASTCGSWPAFWMTGPNWPNSGEIDIIEGVNSQSQNQMTMHTSAGCTLAGGNCQGNQGCALKGGAYGSSDGAIYAMEWTSSQISIWSFARGSAPADLNSANPNPGNWGAPTGSFIGGSGCDIDSHFMNNNIVFDTTFCGDWAGAVWAQDSTCSAKAATCKDYVQNHPQDFAESYWAINSLKVFEANGAVAEIATANSSSTQASISVAQPSSANTSIQPTAVSSGVSAPSANVTVSAQSDGFSTPTPVSPPASGAVATKTVTGTGVLTETRQPSAFPRPHGHHRNRPPFAKRSRVVRHIQEHARSAHHA